jgi:hypothetical protein
MAGRSLIHWGFDTQSDGAVNPMTTLTRPSNAAHAMLGACSLTCAESRGAGDWSGSEPKHRVRGSLDAHVIAEWTGPISIAENHAELLSSQFPSLRLTREPAVDQR